MVLVCVTDQDACDRLIFAGRKLATIEHLDLKVISVQPRHHAKGLASESMEYLFSISTVLSAEMIVLFHDFAPEAVANYIRQNDTSYVIVGQSPDPNNSVFITALEDYFPDLPVISVGDNGALQVVTISSETY